MMTTELTKGLALAIEDVIERTRELARARDCLAAAKGKLELAHSHLARARKLYVSVDAASGAHVLHSEPIPPVPMQL